MTAEMMICHVRMRQPLAALATVVVLGCQADAQSGTSQVPAPSAATNDGATTADLEGCRAQLIETLAFYRELVRDDDARQRVDRVVSTVESLATRDMEVLAPACARMGEWRQAVAAARGLAANRAGAAPGPVAAAGTAFPQAPYSGLCGSARSNTEVLFGVQVALQVARGVWSAASRGCEQVVVVCPVPGGGNGSLACIVADEALFVAEKAVEDVKFCDEDIDSAEIRGTYDRIGFVHDEVVVLDGKVEVLNQKLDALARAVEGLRHVGCDTIRLENTPEGQRASSIPVCADQPGFPYDWPER